MKLIIGNRNYSSWSLRGWLAAKQSGLAFEELTVSLYGDEWEQVKRERDELQPSSGKVPVLWDGEAVIWDTPASFATCSSVGVCLAMRDEGVREVMSEFTH